MPKLPSPSMIVALIALATALGGTAYAVGSIDGSHLKDRSVAARKVEKHSLTGTEINLGKLGKVPRAAHADRATSAGSARSAQTATAARSAGFAQTAANASHATSADNASTVGGLAPDAFVKGGGQRFDFATTLALGTTTAQVYTLPQVGDLLFGCANDGHATVRLRNGTGSTIDFSVSGVIENTTPVANGGSFAALATVGFSNTNPPSQAHYLLAWPTGTHDHVADLTLGWFAAASGCGLIVTGVVR